MNASIADITQAQVKSFIRNPRKWQRGTGEETPLNWKRRLMGLGFQAAQAEKLAEIGQGVAVQAVVWTLKSIENLRERHNLSSADAVGVLLQMGDEALQMACGQYIRLKQMDVQAKLLEVGLSLPVEDPDAYFRVLRVARLVCGAIADPK